MQWCGPTSGLGNPARLVPPRRPYPQPRGTYSHAYSTNRHGQATCVLCQPTQPCHIIIRDQPSREVTCALRDTSDTWSDTTHVHAHAIRRSDSATRRILVKHTQEAQDSNTQR